MGGGTPDRAAASKIDFTEKTNSGTNLRQRGPIWPRIISPSSHLLLMLHQGRRDGWKLFTLRFIITNTTKLASGYSSTKETVTCMELCNEITPVAGEPMISGIFYSEQELPFGERKFDCLPPIDAETHLSVITGYLCFFASCKVTSIFE
ncbi:hypothetical protein NPIL_251001 [Nephila pilipes]|uniref:Uncharacterized protein n=1 Tax=Nephila pilipes TaxID=299642 RepID=A0A8X6T264_NEPPI|nr:hypothetical protein NPIL_251001 [Nephila pilipes]